MAAHFLDTAAEQFEKLGSHRDDVNNLRIEAREARERGIKTELRPMAVQVPIDGKALDKALDAIADVWTSESSSTTCSWISWTWFISYSIAAQAPISPLQLGDSDGFRSNCRRQFCRTLPDQRGRRRHKDHRQQESEATAPPDRAVNGQRASHDSCEVAAEGET